jgi:hypothetical protein
LKTATITPRRLASAALMLLLGVVAVLAPAAVADHGHIASHGKKPKYLSCQPLVNFQDAVQAVTNQTGIAPEMVGSSVFTRLPIHKGSHFPDVPTTECDLGWVNDYGNSTAYGNCNGCTAGLWLSCVAIGVSKQEFKGTIPHPQQGDGGGPCAGVSGPGYTVEKYTPPGRGSQGYVVAHVTGSDPNGPYPIDYNVYAWTKSKGCFVSFDAWPLSLAASEAFVDKAVRSLLKPKSHCSG